MSQRGYLLWKAEELARFKPRMREIKIKTGLGAGSTVVHLSTPNHPTFTEWRRLAYPSQGPKNPLALLPYCDELALAVWIMDDGNMSKENRSLIIATSAFSPAQHDSMIAWFKKRWGVQTFILRYHRKRGGHLALRFRRRDTERIVSLVKDFIHPTMLYKLPPGPKPRGSRAIAGRPKETTTERWKFWFGLLQQYAEREGHAQVTRSHQENGFKLGSWLATQRREYWAGRLPLEGQQLLEGLPAWSWDRGGREWKFWFGLLQQYAEREGHAQVTRSHQENGFKLGQWVSARRETYRAGRLPLERRQLLEGLPAWSWDRGGREWKFWFGLLQQYAEREGHAQVTRSHQENGFKLGHWVSKQRDTYRAGRLPLQRQQLLEDLPGWSWNRGRPEWERQWDEHFAALRRFADRDGTSRVPRLQREDGFMLGKWVQHQRDLFRAGQLSLQQQRRLQELPHWTWDPLSEAWEDGYTWLKRFVGREGHAAVPTRHIEENFNLGQWVDVQRRTFKKNTLAPDRVGRLEELPGWIWATRRAPSKREPSP
jgi:hypothetical protein